LHHCKPFGIVISQLSTLFMQIRGSSSRAAMAFTTKVQISFDV